MALLQESTGIDKKQISRDFGSKTELFVAVLDEYWQLLWGRVLSPMEAEGAGIREIRKVIRTVAANANYPEAQLGCLVCTTALDTRATGDSRVASSVQTSLKRLEQSYHAALKSAQASGEIDMTPRALRRAARALLGAHLALTVLLRAGAPDDVAKDVAEQALAALG